MEELPLEGVRILAVEQFGAGPFGTMVLADLGAEVVKVEEPKSGGDVSRYVPPGRKDSDSLYFQSFNRNKKSITLDLKSPDGREVFHQLVMISDAVFNNLRGDEPERLGLTYAALKEINPKIVCCSLSGFGQTGARRAEPGYDYLIQGLSGFMSLTGEPDGPPGKCGVSVIDFAGGYVAMLGLMIGINQRLRTGRGCEVDVSLFDTATAMLSYLATWTLNTDFRPARLPDSAHQTIVPCQNFQTSDGFIVIFCAKEKFWRNLCTAMGLEELLEDARFKTFEERFENRQHLLAILNREFKRKATKEWIELLKTTVPCAPVNSLEEALSLPQVRERGMIVELEHEQFGTLREVGCPIKVGGSRTPAQPGPRLGEHNEDVLSRYLGYSATRIAGLREKGVIL